VSNVGDVDEVESQSRRELTKGHCGGGKDTNPRKHRLKTSRLCREKIGVNDIYLLNMYAFLKFTKLNYECILHSLL
jgi:hypothetical protein